MSIYFYGHKTSYPYAAFSNFYLCSFVDPATDFTYHSSEQYFMKKKQELFDSENSELAQRIMDSATPAAVKKLGRQVGGFDQALWDEHKLQIMIDGLLLKFGQNIILRVLLLSTNDAQIFEASPSDRIWGIGYSVTEAPEIDRSMYGENLLGIALMEVRSILSQKTTA